MIFKNNADGTIDVDLDELMKVHGHPDPPGELGEKGDTGSQSLTPIIE